MKAYRYRSPVFGRLFWGAFLTSILVLTGVTVFSRPSLLVLTLLTVAAGLISWLLAFLLSRPVDREISRSREFAGSLLDDPSDLAHPRFYNIKWMTLLEEVVATHAVDRSVWSTNGVVKEPSPNRA